MPTSLNFSGRIEARCHPCEWLAEIRATGTDGKIIEHVCLHERVVGVRRDPTMFVFMGAGRSIGQEDVQPDWCPLNQKAK